MYFQRIRSTDNLHFFLETVDVFAFSIVLIIFSPKFMRNYFSKMLDTSIEYVLFVHTKHHHVCIILFDFHTIMVNITTAFSISCNVHYDLITIYKY